MYDHPLRAFNSKNLPIYPTAEGVEAFWRWFSESKVVDASGRPLVAYHGTTDTFLEFSADQLGRNTKHASANMGFFFSVDPGVTSIFNTAIDETQWPFRLVSRFGANTLPAYLSILNPLELTVASFRKSNSWTRDTLLAAGYDGVRILGEPQLRDTLGGDEWRSDTWIALDPAQIKSAIGNDGTFDPRDSSIIGRNHPSRMIESVPEERWLLIAAALPAGASPTVWGHKKADHARP